MTSASRLVGLRPSQTYFTPGQATSVDNRTHHHWLRPLFLAGTLALTCAIVSTRLGPSRVQLRWLPSQGAPIVARTPLPRIKAGKPISTRRPLVRPPSAVPDQLGAEDRNPFENDVEVKRAWILQAIDEAVKANDFGKAQELKVELDGLPVNPVEQLRGMIKEMQEASDNQDFVAAAKMRDEIRPILEGLPEFQLQGVWDGGPGTLGGLVDIYAENHMLQLEGRNYFWRARVDLSQQNVLEGIRKSKGLTTTVIRTYPAEGQLLLPVGTVSGHTEQNKWYTCELIVLGDDSLFLKWPMNGNAFFQRLTDKDLEFVKDKGFEGLMKKVEVMKIKRTGIPLEPDHPANDKVDEERDHSAYEKVDEDLD